LKNALKVEVDPSITDQKKKIGVRFPWEGAARRRLTLKETNKKREGKKRNLENARTLYMVRVIMKKSTTSGGS